MDNAEDRDAQNEAAELFHANNGLHVKEQTMDEVLVKRVLQTFIKTWEGNAVDIRSKGRYENAASIDNMLDHLRDELGWFIS